MIDNKKAGSLEAVEDIYEIAVLLDFYGQLLTDRQYEIMDLYYNSDLSLGEIAEDIGISRQGVYDSIRKAKHTLTSYEKRLGLVERFRQQEMDIEMALKSIKTFEEEYPDLTLNESYKTAVKTLERLLRNL